MPSSLHVHASGTVPLGSRTIHRLGFGSMRLTGPGVWGPPSDRGAAVAVLRRCIDLGVDFIDTADSYGPYVAEELIREALHPYPAHLTIATKAGLVRTGPNQWKPVGRPEYLRQECEMSLRRLGLERIHLFQLHRIDPAVPAEEQFGVLRDLVREGKVELVGLSEVSVAEVETARQTVAVASVQNRYNLADRGAEPVLEHCTAHGIGFIPWFPLASGKIDQPGGALREVAGELQATPHQVALAWLLRRSPAMIPIPGTASLAHLDENCAAAAITLSDSQFERLDRSSGGARGRAAH
jgi:pyridoxine 4-dehydrogenase